MGRSSNYDGGLARFDDTRDYRHISNSAPTAGNWAAKNVNANQKGRLVAGISVRPVDIVDIMVQLL